MALNDNSKVEYESGQQGHPWEQMTSNDNKLFASSFSPWSGRGGKEANIAPFGLVSGAEITPASGNDAVDITACELSMPGTPGADANGRVQVSGAMGVAVVRPSTQDFLITSVTVDNTGAFAMVPGSEGAAFDETRGAAGGPPLIPVDSVELGQIRYNSQVSAAILTTEIFTVVNLHRERYDFPSVEPIEANGEAEFADVLPLIHTGNVAKQVWVTGFTPLFVEQQNSADFVPAQVTNSVSSTPVYGGAIGAVSSSISQSTFTAYLKDGITDGIIAQENQRVWVRFFQDRNRPPNYLTLGVLNLNISFPVGQNPTAACTVSAEDASVARAA